jgi:hypothetical protein
LRLMKNSISPQKGKIGEGRSSQLKLRLPMSLLKRRKLLMGRKNQQRESLSQQRPGKARRESTNNKDHKLPIPSPRTGASQPRPKRLLRKSLKVTRLLNKS